MSVLGADYETAIPPLVYAAAARAAGEETPLGAQGGSDSDGAGDGGTSSGGGSGGGVGSVGGSGGGLSSNGSGNGGEFVAEDSLRLVYAGDFANAVRGPGLEAAALSGRAAALHLARTLGV